MEDSERGKEVEQQSRVLETDGTAHLLLLKGGFDAPNQASMTPTAASSYYTAAASCK